MEEEHFVNYPDNDDPEFYKKLYQKKEFFETMAPVPPDFAEGSVELENYKKTNITS